MSIFMTKFSEKRQIYLKPFFAWSTDKAHTHTHTHIYTHNTKTDTNFNDSKKANFA